MKASHNNAWRIMRNGEIARIIGLSTILLAFLLSAASASGYSVIEDDLEFRVDYPVEMEVGSCYTISFWMKASENLTDLVVVLSIHYHRNSEVDTLYSDTIISEEEVSAGWTKSKTINICIPSEEPKDPYIRADLEFSYKLNGSDKELSYEWYMSIVREESYEDLQSRVSSLQNKISSLEDEIDDLEKELNEKSQKLEDLEEAYQQLLAEYSSLKSSYQELEDDYNKLKDDYSSLESAYKSLSDTHQSTIISLEKLKTEYESLSRRYESLSKQYASLLKDYESTLAELRTYKAMYSDLKARHDDLRMRHDELIAEAARLRQKISDLEENYVNLSRVYEATLGESNLTKNILFAQTAAVAAGLGIYALLSRRFGRVSPPRPAEAQEEGNSEKKIQKILSGRRITIPSDAAAKLGIKEGDKVEIDYANGKLIVKPVKEQPSGERGEGEKNLEEAEDKTS
ncbi:MAG: DUF4201 domain-containing protein [Thaumarchaeota archaeon]|nr:DUF4201 domain-containing protein [Nitrososphaerota archaeon]